MCLLGFPAVVCAATPFPTISSVCNTHKDTGAPTASLHVSMQLHRPGSGSWRHLHENQKSLCTSAALLEKQLLRLFVTRLRKATAHEARTGQEPHLCTLVNMKQPTLRCWQREFPPFEGTCHQLMPECICMPRLFTKTC